MVDLNSTTTDTYEALHARAKSVGLYLYAEGLHTPKPRYSLHDGDRAHGGELIIETTDLADIDDHIASWLAAAEASTGTDSDGTQPPAAVGGQTNGAAPPGGVTESTPDQTDAVAATTSTETVAQETTQAAKPKRTSPTRPHKSKTPEIKGVHHLANFWPMMKADELTNLAADISRSGQRKPIDVTPDGLILDGRNRNRACELAGVLPTVAVYQGDSSTYADFVVSANQRRNLKPSQLVMITAQILKADGRRVEGRWERGSVPVNPEIGINESKTWQNAMARAGTILDHAEELADDVANGKSLNNAFLVAEEKRTGKKQPKPKKKKDPEPTPTQIRAALYASMVTELKKTRTGPTAPKIDEVILAQIRAILSEAQRITHNDINGIPS
jgi:hypothetical protein